MTSPNIRNLVFLLTRLVLAFIVVYVLFAPDKVHRQISPDYKCTLSFTSFTFQGGQHFCRRPDARAVNVTKLQVFQALDISARSSLLLDERILKFGECRAKLKILNEDLNLCNCNPPVRLGIFYRLQLVHSVFSIVVVVFIFMFAYPWECGKKFAPLLILDASTAIMNICFSVYYCAKYRDSTPFDYFVGDPVQWLVGYSISIATMIVYLLLSCFGMISFACRKSSQTENDRNEENLKTTVTSSFVENSKCESDSNSEEECTLKSEIEMPVEDFMIARELVKKMKTMSKFQQQCNKSWP